MGATQSAAHRVLPGHPHSVEARCGALAGVMTTSLRHAIASKIMSSATKRQMQRRETLNIRIRAEERDLIDRAAKARGKNRTDFILEAARQAAEDALLDRALITVNPKAYAEFLARLDAPAKPNERLRRTMRSAAPWKSG
jgi:uncharacterized protein (DUF1778 family)